MYVTVLVKSARSFGLLLEYFIGWNITRREGVG